MSCFLALSVPASGDMNSSGDRKGVRCWMGWSLLLGRVVTGGSIHLAFGLRQVKEISVVCVGEVGAVEVVITREWRKMKAPHLSLVPPP